MNPTFLNRFVDKNGNTNFPEILNTDEKLTNIPWLHIPNTIIEPDNWELFWELWNANKQNAHNLANIWDILYIYVHPDLTEDEIRNTHPGPIPPGQYQDWTSFFPKMFEKIFNLMPYKRIDKISITTNTKQVPIHIDCTQTYHPWPNSLRIMLHDTNIKPTFYLTNWPKESFDKPIVPRGRPIVGETLFYDTTDQSEKNYVALPQDSNTFIYNNGPYLHGADLAKPKILMLIWGEPDLEKWKKKLFTIMEQIELKR